MKFAETRLGKYMKMADIIVIAVLICLSVLLFVLSLIIGNQTGARAVVTADGKVVAELPLDTDTVYTVVSAGGTNTIRISGGEAYVETASCRGGNCAAHSGISRVGEVIVCLPNRVAVTITGPKSESPAVDSVVY